MVVKRKKTTIDGMDREILRTIHGARRALTGNQISKKVNLTPSALAPRLNNLRSQGIIKPMVIQKPRIFKRTFATKPKPVKIRSPRGIFWGIDFTPKPKIRKKKK